MNKLLLKLLGPYLAPTDDTGSSNGGADRGDDFIATEDDDETAQAAAAAKADPTATETDEDKALKGLAAGAPKEEGEDDKDDKKGPKKDSRIPLARHKEILERERSAREAAEVELAKLREGQQVAKVNTQINASEAKVSDLEEKYAELLAEGKTKEATATMREIRQLERTIIEQKAEFTTQVAQAQAVEQVRFDMTVERLETAYPQLKPGADEFDKELVGEILEMKDAFQLKGYTPSQALQKAVGYVIKPETKKQETATTVTPRVDADKVAKDREVDARKRNAAAANAQPPALGKAGADSDKAGGVLDAKTAIKMKYDDFVKLSDDDLARMRGDAV